MTASGNKHLATAGRWLALLVVIPVLALSALRALPAQWPVLAVQLLSFTPWLAVPAAVALVLALLGRSRWLQVSTAALLLCQVFWLFPFDIAKPATTSGPAVPVELKAMNINSEFGQADAARIVQLVRENGVGLLTVQEHTQDAAKPAVRGGPGRVVAASGSATPRTTPGASAVYSRFPLEPVGLVPDTPFRIPTVRLTAAAKRFNRCAGGDQRPCAAPAGRQG